MSDEKAQILLADDDLGFLKAMVLRLENDGFEVVVARDGYHALATAVEHRPDLLILDIHMPAGDGFSIQQRKDKMAPLALVPVIYVTGDKSEFTKRRVEELGAVALVHKPFEYAELRQHIDRALTSRAA